jgi:hypothetical protein
MSERLERRYERLLALFPAAYRREYEDEMLGVLMAAAKPQQRCPGLRETANLVRCAVWMRLSGRGTGSADARWAQPGPAAATPAAREPPRPGVTSGSSSRILLRVSGGPTRQPG